MGIGRAGERYSPELRVVERRVFETASRWVVNVRRDPKVALMIEAGARPHGVG